MLIEDIDRDVWRGGGGGLCWPTCGGNGYVLTYHLTASDRSGNITHFIKSGVTTTSKSTLSGFPHLVY